MVEGSPAKPERSESYTEQDFLEEMRQLQDQALESCGVKPNQRVHAIHLEAENQYLYQYLWLERDNTRNTHHAILAGDFVCMSFVQEGQDESEVAEFHLGGSLYKGGASKVRGTYEGGQLSLAEAAEIVFDADYEAASVEVISSHHSNFSEKRSLSRVIGRIIGKEQ